MYNTIKTRTLLIKYQSFEAAEAKAQAAEGQVIYISYFLDILASMSVLTV